MLELADLDGTGGCLHDGQNILMGGPFWYGQRVCVVAAFQPFNRNPLDSADELRLMQPPSHPVNHVVCPPHVVAGALMLRDLWMTLRAPEQPRPHELN